LVFIKSRLYPNYFCNLNQKNLAIFFNNAAFLFDTWIIVAVDVM